MSFSPGVKRRAPGVKRRAAIRSQWCPTSCLTSSQPTSCTPGKTAEPSLHFGLVGEGAELEEAQARVRELRARVAERNTAVEALADHLTALADDLSMWESTL